MHAMIIVAGKGSDAKKAAGDDRVAHQINSDHERTFDANIIMIKDGVQAESIHQKPDRSWITLLHPFWLPVGQIERLFATSEATEGRRRATNFKTTNKFEGS